MSATETDLDRKLVLEPMRKLLPGSLWVKINSSVFSAGVVDIHGCVKGRTV